MPQQTSGTAATAVIARPIIIDVRAWLDTTTNKVRFEHTWHWENGPVENGRIDIPPGTPATPLHFNLRDDTGLKLRFKAPAEQAMWVSLQGCPPPGPGNGGQITYNTTAPNLLRVTDANSNAQEIILSYMLRFDGDPAGNGPPFEYDPDIRNGGSGTGGGSG